MGSTPIKVMVVDDHLFLREGLRAIIDAQSDLKLVSEAESGEEALEMYATDRPDVVLMDLQMPGMGGVATIEAMKKHWPTVRIIVLTTYAGDSQALRALRAGAPGYLLKNSLRRELLDAIRSVHEGGKHLSAEVAAGIAFHVIDDTLTERETSVLKLAADGNSNKQIAGKLGVVEVTVKGYMKAIFAKLRASDRTHAVTIAARRGIIEL